MKLHIYEQDHQTLEEWIHPIELKVMDQELSSSWAAQVKELFPFKEVLWWRTYFVFFRKLLQRQGSQGLASCASMGRFELAKPYPF